MEKHLNLFSLVLSLSLILLPAGMNRISAQTKSPQVRYVEKYAAIAVSEMYRTGVPASITLAQGILESGAGLSSLAVKSNNHFGIKCHGWKGRKVYHDDDAKGECFRAYDTPEESFRDHSDFLRYRDRYKFLFDYKTTDYKAWAKGLKKAGYATDPNYDKKVIGYIEELDLSRYDTMSSSRAEEISAEEAKNEVVESGSSEPKLSRKEMRAKRKAEKRAEKEARKNKKEKTEEVKDVIPESPLNIEKPKVYRPDADETLNFNLFRQLYSRNGVPYITVLEEETVESISEEYDLFPAEIYRFNDMEPGMEIEAGAIIYLQPKRNQGAKNMDMYIVDRDGESIWAISQRFGIKLKSILKINGLSPDYQTKEGDVILFRKK